MVFKKRSFKKRSFSRKTFTRRPQQPTNMILYRDPPIFSPNITVKHKFRFVCVIPGSGNSAAVLNITDAFLSRLMMLAINGQTTAYELITSFKILELEMWMPASLSAGSTIDNATLDASITWLGGGLATDRVVCANSLSQSRPPYLRTTPPKNSQASFWGLGAGNSNTYFSINNQLSGAFLDLTMLITINVGGTTTTTLNSNSYPTQILYGRLDGIPSSTTGYWQAITGYTDLGVE